MAAASAPLAAALLLCCVAVSAATALAVELYVRRPQKPAVATPPPVEAPVSTPKDDAKEPKHEEKTPDEETSKAEMLPLPLVELRGLETDLVPPALRLETYFSPESLRTFDHARLFQDCTSVFAALDALHPYLSQFFRTGAWMQGLAEIAQLSTLHSSAEHDDSSSEDDDAELGGRLSSSSQSRRGSFPRVRRQLRQPTWIDPQETAEVVIYPEVDANSFCPDKVINLEPGKGSPRRRRLSRGSSRTGGSHGWSRSFDGSVDDVVVKQRVIFSSGTVVLGGTFDVSDGSILIGENVRIEPNVFIKGPTIIGAGCTLRSGTYIRGDVIVGKNVVLRGELKHSIILDEAELCHPGYCGDSICGYKSHFGNQVTTANLNLFYNSSDANLCIEDGGVRYDTGRKKIGVILGDWSQLGCSSVTDPCTLIQPRTIVYPLARLAKGIYGPNAIVKNKPMQKGVLEIVPIRSVQSSAATSADV